MTTTTDSRITKFSTGNLGLRVNGIQILLSVGDGQSDAAAALAAAITAIGPEMVEREHPVSAPLPERPTVQASKRIRFQVGQSVWCNVSAIRRWMIVDQVRERDGYIKVDGGRVWCPPHNFDLEAR